MDVNIYALLLGLGASLACWQVVRSVQLRERGRWASMLLLVLVGALLGARAWFVLQMVAFSGQALPFFAVWQGGLGWPGAMLGGLVVLAGFIAFWRLPAALTFDRMLPLFVLLPVTAWLGCWQVGCVYGQPLPEGALFGLRMLDESGVTRQRFPLQFLVVLVLLVVVIALLVLQRRHLLLPGQLAAAFGVGLGLDLLLMTFLRADPQPRWQGWPVEAWAAVVLTAFCAAAFFLAGRSAKPEW